MDALASEHTLFTNSHSPSGEQENLYATRSLDIEPLKSTLERAIAPGRSTSGARQSNDVPVASPLTQSSAERGKH